MSLVLVIDIQERLTPVMSGAEELIANSLKFLQIAKELGIKIIATEQYPKGLDLLTDKSQYGFAKPSRLVGYLIFFQIRINNPQFVFTHQTNHTLFSLRS